MPYIKTKTVIEPEAITIAKAVALSGVVHPAVINTAIATGQLDFGYVLDELKTPPTIGIRPRKADTNQFGNKVVIVNEKWKTWLRMKKLTQQLEEAKISRAAEGL